MRSVPAKIAAVLLALVLVIYLGYQGYRYFGKSYKTEVAYEYTAADSFQTTGIVIRDEVVLDTAVDASSVVSYPYEDGTKLSLNMTVAQIYHNTESENTFQRIKTLENQIEALEYAQNNSSYGQTENISKQLVSALGDFFDSTVYGQVNNLEEQKVKISMLLNQKQISIGKATDFNTLITQLKDEVTYLTSTISSDAQEVVADQNGYFCKTVDGYENLVTVTNMNTLSVEQYKNFIDQPQTNTSNSIGKMMLSQNWYFAIVVDQSKIERFQKGTELDLIFTGSKAITVDATVERIITDESSTDGVILLKCNMVTDELINMRVENVQVKFRTYTGLKINEDAIRFVDNTPGVYVVSGEYIVFKKIDIIYEDTGFVISSINADDSYVKQFDQVVVGGTDLYDGKPA